MCGLSSALWHARLKFSFQLHENTRRTVHGCPCSHSSPDWVGEGARAAAIRTSRRVSGGWIVRLGWIPAWAATSSRALLFNRWHKSCFSLGRAAGFLCCIPTSMEFVGPFSACSPTVARLHGAASGEPQSEICVPNCMRIAL